MTDAGQGRLQRLGLRAQIVLSLAALLTAVFGFTAVAVWWVLRASWAEQRRTFAALAVEAHLQELADQIRRGLPASLAGARFDALLGQAGLTALGWYDAQGQPTLQRGLRGQGPDLQDLDPRRPRPYQTHRSTPGRDVEELLFVWPIGAGRGSLVGVAELTPNPEELGQMLRPIFLYLIASGLLLLSFGYVALTAVIVRPLEGLIRATDQVRQGHLEVQVPLEGGREIFRAALAFNAMTAQLLEQQRRLENQVAKLKQTTDQLQTTQDQLVRSAKLASVGSLAAGVAHEVGNPVSAIMGLSEVLLDDECLTEERRDYLERIRREAERVHRIIKDLLAYARPSKADEGPAVVAEALDAALGLLAPQKTFRQIDLHITVEDDLPPAEIGVDQLTQVLVNVLLNAADAVAGTGTIHVRAVLASRGVNIDVWDSGPGVPEELLPHIFEPFFTTKPPGAGTGLGLAICEGILERAEGFISARNQPQGGLCVTIGLSAFQG